ncbi:MAG TPA: acetolactate synthase [Opitutae bacterium]|nr:acetolactate synthase [Opitutae bacterium]
MKRKGDDPVTQFSIYAANKVGRLNDLVSALASHDIHIMAICTIDTTDSSIIRLVVDYTELAREVLVKNNFRFNEVEVLAIEMEGEDLLKKVTCSLLQAEINIHYVYPFLVRPNNQTGLILSVEDVDLANDVLKRNMIKVLRQSDIAR